MWCYIGRRLYAPYEDWGDAITCKELIGNATLFETGGPWCAEYEYAEEECCAQQTKPDDPCTPCPNGITVANDDDGPYNNGYTCSDYLDYYAYYDAKSDICTVGWGVLETKAICCPSTVANNPCIICPDGASLGKILYSTHMIGVLVRISLIRH